MNKTPTVPGPMAAPTHGPARSAPYPPTSGPAPQPTWTDPQSTWTDPQAIWPAAPTGGATPGGPGSGGTFVPPPAEPRIPWWQRDGVISRILVLAGVTVTLAGVVMLLVLAAQQGLLVPQVRVAAGAVLAAALAGSGWRVMERVGGRVGGTALLATGFAGGYLDVLAVTTVYDWVPSAVGLAAAFALAVAGVTVAMRWNSQALAVLVQLGCALLAPSLTGGAGVELALFLTVLAVAGALPELHRGWFWVGLARTVPVVLALLWSVALDSDGDVLIAGSAAIIGGVGLATGLVAARRSSTDPVPAISLLLAALPAIVVPTQLGTPAALVWLGVLACVTLAAAYAARPLGEPVRFAVGAVACAALLHGAAILSGPLSPAQVFLALAVLLTAVAARMPSPITLPVGAMSYTLAFVLYLVEVTPLQVANRSTALRHLDAHSLIASLLALVAGVLLMIAIYQVCTDHDQRCVSIGLVGASALYPLTAATVSASVMAVRNADGFYFGHGLATVLCMIGGAMLLRLGLAHPAYARTALTGGLALVAASLAKLFLFDLGALGGIARAAAFLVVGLLLLAVGTWYARSFAEQDARRAG